MTKPATVADTAVESRTGDMLLIPIALSAFWTLAYQLVLVARWPAQTIVWCFFAISALGMFFLARVWKQTDATPGRRYRFHPSQILVLVLGVACAVTVLFIRRPNQDDIVYFHRALAQLSALGQPVSSPSDERRYGCRGFFTSPSGNQPRDAHGAIRRIISE